MRCPACNERAVTFNDWLAMPKAAWRSLHCRACGCPLAGHGQRIAVWVFCSIMWLGGAVVAWLYCWTEEMPPRPGLFMLSAVVAIAVSGVLLWSTGRCAHRSEAADGVTSPVPPATRAPVKPMSKTARVVAGVMGVVTIGIGMLGGLTGRFATRAQIAQVEPGSTGAWVLAGLLILLGIYMIAFALLAERRQRVHPAAASEPTRDRGSEGS